MSTPPTDSRSASESEPLALLEAVRDVAELTVAIDAERISTRRWDAGRALSERFGDAPAARRICEHLGLPWAKVRELAFMPRTGQRIALGRALNEQQGNWLTADYSDYVLALVARRLGVPALTPGQYRSEREALLNADRGRRTHGGQLRLPTEDQVAALAGTWDRALAHAGLRARRGLGGHRTRVGPVAIVAVLDRCFEHHGTEPNATELNAFARANGIPLPRKEVGRPYSDYVREWKDVRRDQGLPVPDGPPPKAQRPDYTLDVGAGLPGERRSRKRWDDRNECLGWVVRYLRQLTRGQRSSQRGYAAWARGQDGAPWPDVFNQYGGWVAMRDAAQGSLKQVPRRSASAR